MTSEVVDPKTCEHEFGHVESAGDVQCRRCKCWMHAGNAIQILQSQRAAHKISTRTTKAYRVKCLVCSRKVVLEVDVCKTCLRGHTDASVFARAAMNIQHVVTCANKDIAAVAKPGGVRVNQIEIAEDGPDGR